MQKAQQTPPDRSIGQAKRLAPRANLGFNLKRMA
jgi:hypothetical protein